MRTIGDRRRYVRLEVVGSLWGTVGLNRQARIVNISGTGALIASPVPVDLNSTQSVRLTLEGRDIKVDAKVRHTTEVAGGDGEPAHYQVGLEFLGAPPDLAEALG